MMSERDAAAFVVVVVASVVVGGVGGEDGDVCGDSGVGDGCIVAEPTRSCGKGAGATTDGRW